MFGMLAKAMEDNSQNSGTEGGSSSAARPDPITVGKEQDMEGRQDLQN